MGLSLAASLNAPTALEGIMPRTIVLLKTYQIAL
jgi:hypothetical protein